VEDCVLVRELKLSVNREQVDAAKLKACPAPADFTAPMRDVWRALILSVPLGSFSAADRNQLVTYCRADSELALIAARKNISRGALARQARLMRMLRQISLRLNLKGLTAQESRSADAVIEQEADNVLSSMHTGRRAGLWGGRVIDSGYVQTSRLSDDT
jgi:hypothetical protein